PTFLSLFLIILPPPRSTLFPYTTLFRSGTLTVASSRTLDMGTNALSGAFTTSGTGTLQTQNTSGTPLSSGKTWTTDVEYNSASGDRKSTRLNSSHVAISYAVFCLKKKKK